MGQSSLYLFWLSFETVIKTVLSGDQVRFPVICGIFVLLRDVIMMGRFRMFFIHSCNMWHYVSAHLALAQVSLAKYDWGNTIYTMPVTIQGIKVWWLWRLSGDTSVEWVEAIFNSISIEIKQTLRNHQSYVRSKNNSNNYSNHSTEKTGKITLKYNFK